MRPASLFFLFSSVSGLRGVGPQVLKALGRLLCVPQMGELQPSSAQVQEPLVRDLLFHLPVGLVDRRQSFAFSDIAHSAMGTFTVQIEKHEPPPRTKQAVSLPYKVLCGNETGYIALVFFHAHTDYLSKALPVGQWRVISGKVERTEYGLQMVHPDIIAPLADLEKVKRLEPVYALTQGITNRQLIKLMDQALPKIPRLEEWGNVYLFAQARFPSWQQAVRQVHQPAQEEDIIPSSATRKRLAYDEILANQLALALLRSRTRKQAGIKIQAAHKLRNAVTLPFTLTQGQRDILQEIGQDIASGHRMVRLLQGDVGSGKTVVALLAMLDVVECGYQAAFMVPTGIVASQHREFIATLAEKQGVKVALLTAAVKGAKRNEILASIAAGDTQIVIGTHALFQEDVIFKNLALIVVDEQHRFGVSQRMALAEKGNHPHLLQMTATPIPRSLAMTAFGDMDSSELKEKPAGRTAIDTRAVPLARVEEVITGLARAIAQGNKIYWVCPLIEKDWAVDNSFSPEEDIAAAEARYAEFLPRFKNRVGLAHGRMKADKREEILQGFAGDEFDILVATTVVEVGVNVPSATVMVIEHAERFGLSQLHQLRGRVGRSDKASSCILLYTDNCGQTAKARLRALRETQDGFRIAEEDMRLRGAGDILGTKQSGLPEFRFVDFALHADLIIAARDDIKLALHQDPMLQSKRGEALRTLLYLFGYDASLKAIET